MSHHWLLITFSWFGTARLQYINTGGPGADTVLEPLDTNLHYPIPYINYFNLPPKTDFDTYQSDGSNNENYNQFYHNEHGQTDLQRKRRTVDEKEAVRDKRWLPNLVDTDKTMYLHNDDNLAGSPFIARFSGIVEDNATDMNLIESMDKKSFSPWGGKRDINKPTIEHMWTWKRSSNLREPSMPKRVRFSPWGGKRSGQMIYKPGSKGSKVIFSSSMPEVTRVVSNFSPNGERFDLAGFHFIPSLEKRHPIKILALSTKLDDKTLKDALPFKTFLESLPKMYKPGHPYLDVNLNKDGKRKVKFSAWGGKRSPPIIGPIWTPAPQDIKESALNTILLIRNNQDDETMKAF
ncbi:leucokinin [Aphomia sociella]